MRVRRRRDGCLTGGGDQANLGADRALASLAESAHLDDVGAPLGQRQHRRGVDGPRHLPVALPLLLEQHLQGVFGRKSLDLDVGCDELKNKTANFVHSLGRQRFWFCRSYFVSNKLLFMIYYPMALQCWNESFFLVLS